MQIANPDMTGRPARPRPPLLTGSPSSSFSPPPQTHLAPHVQIIQRGGKNETLSGGLLHLGSDRTDVRLPWYLLVL